jgi:glycosyltransferase involved in cell wall biosynthesis
VFAARQPPFPLTHGAAIRTHRLLVGLARELPVTFVTYAHEPGADGHFEPQSLAEQLPGVHVVTVPGLAGDKRWAQVRSLASARSWQWGRFAMRPYGDALRRVVQETRAGVVHFDDPGVGMSGPIRGTVSVYAPHNVEHRILAGTAEAEGGLRGSFAQLEWRKIRREEQRLWRTMSLCVAVSDVDAAAFRRGGAQRVELCPNGADPVPVAPPPRRAPNEPLRLLFVGTASYRPYERGIAWLIREVLPLVRDTVPVTLDVVGAPPAAPVRAPDVTYRGRVDALAPWYEQAHVVVVPVFHGSGTRLKVVEAMAYGRPVVSTRLGAEGLPIRAPEHYLEADDNSTFARSLVELAESCRSDDPRLERMLDRAHRAITPLFWPSLTARLAALYRTEMQRSQS